MPKLQILADGDSEQAKANARGKLFEELMRKVLSSFGYQIDEVPNVNYSGMEIDIEGKLSIAGTPLYVECKCYSTMVSAPDFQKFFGKYMARWFKDHRCQGLFVAIPGINSHAKAFYRDHCENNSDISLRILEEGEVLEAMYRSKTMARPEEFSKVIDPKIGQLGDCTILYTERGCFGIQYTIQVGATLPNSVAILDASGRHLSTADVIEYLTELYPDLKEYEIIPANYSQPIISETHDEQVVEIRGSSACFEYQFPASPEYFVGRDLALEQLQSFANQIVAAQITSRGIVFQGNSGWGKSSLVLAGVHMLQQSGHLAVAIDSRTASSTQYILRAIDYVFNNILQVHQADLGVKVHDGPLSGFDGAVDMLETFGNYLETQNKILFIFFDQFENIFHLPSIATSMQNFFARILDAQTNIVIGFSWKTDLIGHTNDFPYHVRESIRNGSQQIYLARFSDTESTTLIDRLESELGRHLRKDLRFFLSEFSQGYPWLLKKLCAHVQSQIGRGVSQQNIADSLLNVGQLFSDDITGLSPEQEEALRRIARYAPVSVSDMAEEFDPQILQSLVDARLLVRIGPMYDIYWDIFRDYLNSEVLPVQENYILHYSASLIFRSCVVISVHGGQMDVEDFRGRAGLTSIGTFYNVTREMRLLGLAAITNNIINLQIPVADAESQFEDTFRAYLRDKLRRNRLIARILAQLEAERTLLIGKVADILQAECPYISASQTTWNTYARIFAGWMEVADLAAYNKSSFSIEHYSPENTLRQNDVLTGRKKNDMALPSVQYGAIEKVSIRLVNAVRGSGRVDWSDIPSTTRSKALSCLEQLQFIQRRSGRIMVSTQLQEFVASPDSRTLVFAERAMRIPSFALFVDILNTYEFEGRSLTEVGQDLNRSLNLNWKDSTAEANAKIMMNWARNAGLAPGVFAAGSRSQSKGGMD